MDSKDNQNHILKIIVRSNNHDQENDLIAHRSQHSY